MEESRPPARERPAAVANAVTLLFSSLAIGFVILLWNWSLYTQVDVGDVAFYAFIGYVFMALLIYHIDEGRNWARIVLLVLFIIGLPSYFRGLVALFAFSFFLTDVLSLSQLTLQIVALVFLFGRDARPWFHPINAGTPSAPDDFEKTDDAKTPR